MSEETKKIDLGGYSLRARTLSEGDRTFVLIHGFADGFEVWDGVAPALAKQARVVLLEQRGHGYSGGPTGPYQWDDLGKDVVAVLDDLGIQKATLVGHALGGLVALMTALQAPERVERLVVLGTATEANAEQRNWCTEILKAGRMNALEGIAHSIFGPINRKPVEGTAGPMMELARRMETLEAEPITDRMKAVSCPTLVLVGENDPALSQSLADALPNGTLEKIAGQAHFPHKKEPATVVAAIEKFAST
jgi:pimeloyl-ACP methyl ester carboxylesterase